MAYDHRTKAGNLGDLVKHALLAELVDRVCAARPAGEFRYVESHGGFAHYRVSELGAGWRQGVGRFWRDAEAFPDGAYQRVVLAGAESDPERYPGSLSIVRAVVESRGLAFRYRAWDTEPEVVDSLTAAHGPGASRGDGFEGAAEALATFTPDLVFLDPPYTAPADWDGGAALLPTVPTATIGVAWFPIAWWTHPARLVQAAGPAGFAVQTLWAAVGRKPSPTTKGCGLLVAHAVEHEPALVGLAKAIGASLRNGAPAVTRTHTVTLRPRR